MDEADRKGDPGGGGRARVEIKIDGLHMALEGDVVEILSHVERRVRAAGEWLEERILGPRPKDGDGGDHG